MKIYIAIGHWKDDMDLKSIVLEHSTKEAFINDCRHNEFIPYVVITEQTFRKLREYEYRANVYKRVTKMLSNYKVWSKVTEYIYDGGFIIEEKINELYKNSLL